ncbi:MAG: universal stress protein [Desulfobulbaceae bacterium]|nr:universal stress protein [Desulfobulbaceae bacterium]
MITAPRSMLVASDFSKNSTMALKRAASLAFDLGARLELLHVVEQNPLDFLFSQQEAHSSSELAEAALRQLRDQAEREIPEGVEYRYRVETGKAFLTIIRAARRMQAGLIVVAAHGRHSLRDLFIGTTTEKVVRKSGLPVLVVKKNPRTPYRRVLVPTDFSGAAAQALSAVLTLAPDAQIDLLHVYSVWGEGYLTSDSIRDAAQERYHREIEGRASSAMRTWLRDNDFDDLRIRQHTRQGRPGTVIPEATKELAADLVAMGTTGRAGLSYVLLGSVAEHALWQVPCDLLTVRPAGFSFELP